VEPKVRQSKGAKVKKFCWSPFVGAVAVTCTNGKCILTDCTVLGLVTRAVKILRIFLFFFQNISIFSLLLKISILLNGDNA
jgi:hypothetical protein